MPAARMQSAPVDACTAQRDMAAGGLRSQPQPLTIESRFRHALPIMPEPNNAVKQVKQTAQDYIVPPCPREVDILYQDDYLLLVHKPDLLLSVPGKLPQNKDCMITRIQRAFPSATVVHRLDLDTSGIMLVPLCREAHSVISRHFQERRIYKSYIAEVFGLVSQDHGEIDLPIACDWQNRPRQKICHARGKQALTRYEVIARFPQRNTSRLLLKPLTGRSHQLRIHLATIGHPILGCDLYAHDDALNMAPRLLLHAQELGFRHPVTGEDMLVKCPVEF